jgi:hypothetical protein
VLDVLSEYLLISVMLKVVGVKNTKYLGVKGLKMISIKFYPGS